MGLLTDTKLSTNLTTVPEAVRNYLQLEDGDRIEWHVEGEEIVVRRHPNGTDVVSTEADGQ